MSYVTVLSVEVEAELLLLKRSTTLLFVIVGIIVPAPKTLVAAKFQVILSVVESDQDTPVAEPL